jgi:hypothetical protein
MIIIDIGFTNDDFINCKHTLIVKKDHERMEQTKFHDDLMNNTSLMTKYIKRKAGKYVTEATENVTVNFFGHGNIVFKVNL